MNYASLIESSASANSAAICFMVITTLWFAKCLFLWNKENLSEEKEDDTIDEYDPEPLVENHFETYPEEKPNIVRGKVGLYININGTDCLNFGSHNYLGFIGNKEIEDKAMECISECGVGACGPPLFYGTNVKHLEFEKALSDFLGCEEAIIYPQGFAAVASAIPVYVKKNDIVFVDEKMNFAIQSGITASKCDFHCFKHNDAQDLEQCLECSKDLLNRKNVRGFIIIEGISKNTGQICPLRKIVALAKQYKLRIFIDETISFCTLGSTGRGVTEHFEIPMQDIDLIMGSLEFALGSGGGFCAGPKHLIEHQVLRGLGHIFSAALPPFFVTAASEALKHVKNHPENLYALKNVCKMMHEKLNSSEELKRSFSVDGNEESPVHVLTLKTTTWTAREEQNCLKRIVDYCLSEQVALVGSDLATSTPSLQLVSNVGHTEEHISQCVEVLEYACIKFCHF